MAGQTYMTSDLEVIRRWAAARAGQPALMPSQEKNAAIAVVPHIVLPAHAYTDVYTTISWQELFDRMQQEALVFVYQEETASGNQSRFCRFVGPLAAEGVEAEPDTRQAQFSAAMGLYQTEDLDTPPAREMQALRHPHRATSRSWPLFIGLAVLVVLVVGLIIGMLWSTS